MPKPASDSLLTCTVLPSPNQREQNLEAVRQDVANGAVLWDVNISEYSEHLGAQPGSERAAKPDPYIEADFTILQHDGQLTVVKWAITGTGAISTSKSRIPLHAFARAALIAVEDALAANAKRTYEEMIAQRRGHRSFYEMSNGRLLDPETHEQRKPPPRRTHAYATNGDRPGLELAQVVDEYRKAIERGSRSPTADVARAFNVGRSTAARSLAEAREQGLLGPALRNRAGERRDR